MQWDIFCEVIDNHGDIGVCWRLACQLAARDQRVRLWVDDGAALRWMAPQGNAGVQVIDWSDAAAVTEAARQASGARAPHVLIEAFGCNPAPELIACLAAALSGADDADANVGTVDDGIRPPAPYAWINLEYLSAEDYVERMHGLPSLVRSGPGTGLTKHFFYPGFTAATGGLLREPDLSKRQAAFDRPAWLAAQGIDWHGERLVSLFCYEPTALPGLLARWANGPQRTRLLVTAGRAAQAVTAALQQIPNPGALSMSILPLLTHPEFDELLWACDLNFVRGEDSLVRAIWAGKPFVWQIYPQDDDVHQVKLEAFLLMLAAPPSLRRFYKVWNDRSDTATPVPFDPCDAELLQDWSAVVHAARDRLCAQPDLVTQLLQFVRRLT